MSESKIKETREGLGFTRKEIHEAFGIPMRTLLGYENGERKPAPWVENMLIKSIIELGKKKAKQYTDFAEKMEDDMK